MRVVAANVDAILGGEMTIHRAYMKRLDITEEQVFSIKPALANLSYTNYMLSVAQIGGPMEIVASILACSWSYAEIGQALAAIPGAAEHPFYGEWIRGYASEEYAATNQALIELMDSLAADAGEEQLAYLTDVFVNCSRYELGFWDMAWDVQPWVFCALTTSPTSTPARTSTSSMDAPFPWSRGRSTASSASAAAAKAPYSA